MEHTRKASGGRVKKALVAWAIGVGIGAAVPLLLLLARWVIARDPQLAGLDYSLYRLGSLVWPSSVWLMATEGIENTFQGYVIVGISIAANALLYSGVVVVFWWLGAYVRMRK